MMLLPTIDELSNTPEELLKRKHELKCVQRWCQAALAELYRALYAMPLPNIRTRVKENSQHRATETEMFYFFQKNSVHSIILELDEPAETPQALQSKFERLMYYRSIFQAHIDQIRLEISSLEQVLAPL